MIACVFSYAECCCQGSRREPSPSANGFAILLYQGRAEDASNKKGTVVEMIRTAITAAIVALFSLLLLPMLGALGQKADADDLAPGVTTLRFFEHDTQQTNLDLLRWEGPGDQSLFAGDLFDHAGGTQVGHTAGQCTALSGIRGWRPLVYSNLPPGRRTDHHPRFGRPCCSSLVGRNRPIRDSGRHRNLQQRPRRTISGANAV